MNLDEARDLLTRTLHDWLVARDMQRESARQVESANLIISGILKGFPELEEEMRQEGGQKVEELQQVDDDEAPRGAEAVLRVLQVNENRMYSVAQMVSELESRGWLPDSENDPANAVRTALERVLKNTPGVKKIRKEGAVYYRYNEPEPEPGGAQLPPPALAYDPMQTILSGGPHPESGGAAG